MKSRVVTTFRLLGEQASNLAQTISDVATLRLHLYRVGTVTNCMSTEYHPSTFETPLHAEHSLQIILAHIARPAADEVGNQERF